MDGSAYPAVKQVRKMKILFFLHLFISLILVTGSFIWNRGNNCNHYPEWQKSEVSEAYMNFAVQFYKFVSMRSAGAPPNLFFSPLSIYTTLSMLALGAQSTTRMEILQAMGLNDTKTNQELHECFRQFLQRVTQQIKEVEFKLGNEIFIDRSADIFPQFQQNVSYYYNVSVETINFSDPQGAEKIINTLVSNRTHNKIQNMVKNLDPKILMVLLDYSVFQAKWQKEFNPQGTEEDNFRVDGQAPVTVPMMHQQGTYKTYKDKEMRCNVVEVPYTSNITLLLIVPKPGDLQKVERKLSTERIKKYFCSMRTSTVDLYIPKVSFNIPLKIRNAILTMGIGSMFSGDNADFSRMSNKSRLRVSDIFHQSYTSITEGGTEGSGVTASNTTSLYSNPELKVDRPFLMLVYHKITATILWMGRVKDPFVKERHRSAISFCTMRWTFVFILLFGLCLAHQPTKGKPKKDQHRQEKIPLLQESTSNLNATEDISALNISNMNSNFGFDLYRRTADKHDDNIFFSPFSVSFLLGVLTLGTQGKTHDQMLSGLGWGPLKKQKNPNLLHKLLKDLKSSIMKGEGYSLDLGSLSLLHESFNINQEFLNQSMLYFNMEFLSVDFHDRHILETIRDLIRAKTKGRISELQDEIDPQTKMMLLDFIFFKGKWQTPFKPDATNTDTFYVNKYTSVKVPMMYKTEKVASMFDKSLSCTVLNLPYRGGAHMLVVVPENDGNFDALEDGLSSELVASWLNKMKTRKTDIIFPKFKLDHKYKLKSSLEELGIKDIFTGKANLTGMTEERNLMLSEVTQRAVIDIDEIGTEATAISGAEITAYSLDPTIRINRPFIFMIFDEKFKSLLFIGRVTDPSKH
ncbi:PREDICTED: uncharacterized protein LOC108789395 [Nanorana parkeri]|uniref:uncharacterized protein LOC108789395 n=1 Tax=Nanorana parkeri TaxID=125878 RepID=UPI000854430C|nr:PREDICTED: uncharacterized protein LOC108789395 [Nanorana parkeri]